MTPSSPPHESTPGQTIIISPSDKSKLSQTVVMSHHSHFQRKKTHHPPPRLGQWNRSERKRQDRGLADYAPRLSQSRSMLPDRPSVVKKIHKII